MLRDLVSTACPSLTVPDLHSCAVFVQFQCDGLSAAGVAAAAGFAEICLQFTEADAVNQSGGRCWGPRPGCCSGWAGRPCRWGWVSALTAEGGFAWFAYTEGGLMSGFRKRAQDVVVVTDMVI